MNKQSINLSKFTTQRVTKPSTAYSKGAKLLSTNHCIPNHVHIHQITSNPSSHLKACANSATNNELVIEENGNDLIAKTTAAAVRLPATLATGQSFKKTSKTNIAQFENDMKKYGLQEKITHIERFNSKIAGIIGPTNGPSNAKSSMFPFQRRNRSSSPPKESPLNNLMVNRSGSPTPFKVKHTISKNFVICAQSPQNFELLFGRAAKDEFEKFSSDSRNSTNQTEEDLKRSGTEEPENWMYKTWNRKGIACDVPKDDKTVCAMIGFLKEA